MLPSTSPSEFIKKNYTDLKALNPGLPIYIRPCDGAEPHVAARYGKYHHTQVMVLCRTCLFTCVKLNLT